MAIKNNGEDILYHFFQKQLLANNPEFAKTFIKQAINALSIWIHPDFFQKLPVILPFVVRDPSCRKDKKTGKDEWGSPNEMGLLRDDNSLFKGIIKSMPVISAGDLYKEITLENGFVAAHIWRQTADTLRNGELASRNPWLNTFIPNLVWLPKQIAKMTDREGDFAQQYVQALSRHIYIKCQFKPALHKRVQALWDYLPEPPDFAGEIFPDVSELNFFEPRENIISSRIKKIDQVASGIEKILLGQHLEKKIIASRYTNGLPLIDHNNLAYLFNNLRTYLDELK